MNVKNFDQRLPLGRRTRLGHRVRGRVFTLQVYLSSAQFSIRPPKQGRYLNKVNVFFFFFFGFPVPIKVMFGEAQVAQR